MGSFTGTAVKWEEAAARWIAWAAGSAAATGLDARIGREERIMTRVGIRCGGYFVLRPALSRIRRPHVLAPKHMAVADQPEGEAPQGQTQMWITHQRPYSIIPPWMQ